MLSNISRVVRISWILGHVRSVTVVVVEARRRRRRRGVAVGGPGVIDARSNDLMMHIARTRSIVAGNHVDWGELYLFVLFVQPVI